MSTALIAGRTFAARTVNAANAQLLEAADARRGAAKRCCASCTRSTPSGPQRGCIRADEKRIIRALEVWQETGRTITEHNRETQTDPDRPATRLSGSGPGFHGPRRSLRAHRPPGRDHAGTAACWTKSASLLASGRARRRRRAMQAIGYKEFVAYLTSGESDARRGDGALPAALAQLCQAAADVVPPESCDALDLPAARSRTQTRFLRQARQRISPFSRKKYDRVLGITDI